MPNIILTGMPGAGKSTVGVILAKDLGFGFVDLDILISKRKSGTLQEIIDNEGLEQFLVTEEEEALALKEENTVIATGGSVVLSEKAMQRLMEGGINIFLDVPIEELHRRLTNIKTRGIAFKPGETVEDVYRERMPLYRKYAKITIECKNKTTEDIVSEISGIMRLR